MANSSHKYYLSIDDEIVYFDIFSEYLDISSFITLCLFTGMFASEEELLEALDQLGVTSKKDSSPFISIVKNRRDSAGNNHFNCVSDKILYKRLVPYLGFKSVESFLFANRFKYAILKDFFDEYLVEIDNLIESFKTKITRLEVDVSSQKDKEKTKTRKEIEKKKNSLHNFIQYDDNVREILGMISTLSSLGRNYNFALESEFMSRLTRFVEDEVTYKRGRKRTPNYRGLVKLVLKMDGFLQKYPELEKPQTSNKFRDEHIKIMQSYKKVLDEVAAKREARRQAYYEDEPSDPDDYMFLTFDDYDAMKKNSSPQRSESVDADLENLEEKQGNYRSL